MTDFTLTQVNDLLLRAGLSFELKDPEFERITNYFRLRQSWSSAHNIAGPRSMESPWRTDLIDAVALTLTLDPELPLVDVGTGSGTPGLLVACLLPKKPVLLVEPIAKRTAFLRHTAHHLQLRAVKTKRSRWPCAHTHTSIQVVSRAVIDPNEWPSLALAGGPSVHAIIRMLALHRPEMAVEQMELAAFQDYEVPEAGHRRVECWTRKN